MQDPEKTDLANQWILITGASKGLGKAFAVALAEAGANLVLTARSGELLERLRQEIEPAGVGSVAVAGDLTDRGFLDRLIQIGLDKQIDVLINNAGIVVIKPLVETTPEQIDHLLELNLTIPIRLTRAFLPMFRARGSGTVINVNSGGGRKPVLHHTIYCAAKYGLNGFAETLRMEVKGENVRVVNVSPGKMATELFAAAGVDWDTSTFIPPADVANALVATLQLSPRSCPSEIAIDRMG